MKPKDLRDWIDSLTDDIEFEYQGIHGAICPFNRQNIVLCYSGEEMLVHSIDEAMTTPFINGKSLNEIAEKLDVG